MIIMKKDASFILKTVEINKDNINKDRALK